VRDPSCERCAFANENGWWGPGPQTHCRDCHRDWDSTKQVHCVVCHEQFASDGVAGKHLIRGHRHPSEVSALRASEERHGRVWRGSESRPERVLTSSP
jgi:hypothetical protein